MERRKPKQNHVMAGKSAVRHQEIRVIQMAMRRGYSLHQVGGPVIGSKKVYYQLMEGERKSIVLGENLDATLNQIEAFPSQKNSQ